MEFIGRSTRKVHSRKVVESWGKAKTTGLIWNWAKAVKTNLDIGLPLSNVISQKKANTPNLGQPEIRRSNYKKRYQNGRRSTIFRCKNSSQTFLISSLSNLNFFDLLKTTTFRLKISTQANSETYLSWGRQSKGEKYNYRDYESRDYNWKVCAILESIKEGMIIYTS